MPRRYEYYNRNKRKNQPFIRKKENPVLNRILEERLENRTVENVQGLQINEFEYKELNRLINKINKQNKVKYEKFKDKKLISYGQETDMTVGDRIALEGKTMGSLYSQKYGYLKNTLLNRFQQFETKQEFKDYIDWLKKRTDLLEQNKKLKTYKRNYIQSLFTTFGDTKEIRAIVNKIKNMKPAKVEETYMTNEQAFIDYIYKNKFDEYDDKINTLKNIWGVNETV